MNTKIFFLLLSVVLSGCLPTLDNSVVTPAVPPDNTVVSAVTVVPPTPTPDNTVVITGNVWVRDDNSQGVGWLLRGTVVNADCEGELCRLTAGEFAGFTFWRGCSTNNPDRLTCKMKGS
jgi:hypothetical protein